MLRTTMVVNKGRKPSFWMISQKEGSFRTLNFKIERPFSVAENTLQLRMLGSQISRYFKNFCFNSSSGEVYDLDKHPLYSSASISFTCGIDKPPLTPLMNRYIAVFLILSSSVGLGINSNSEYRYSAVSSSEPPGMLGALDVFAAGSGVVLKGRVLFSVVGGLVAVVTVGVSRVTSQYLKG